MQKLLPFSKALALILKNLPDSGIKKVDIHSAAGLVLRKPVNADRPLPPFNRSAMDGYAVRASDLRGGKAVLKCLGVLEAGKMWDGKIGKGECLKIMTGAPVPQGADAVIKVEQSRPDGSLVELAEPEPKKWLNVHRRGSDTREGRTLINPGELVTPLNISVASSVGATSLAVSRKIKTIVLTTGNEVIPASQKPKPWQIRDSNGIHLISRLNPLNMADARFGGILQDDKKVFKREIKKALAQSQLLIITGGVSMGDSDYTFSTLRELGVKELFHKTAIRPGKPVWFGIKGDKVVFGLPGNPVSVSVTFHEFVLPAIRKMSGIKNPEPGKIVLPLGKDIAKKHSLREFRVGSISPSGNSVSPVRSYKGSGDFVSASKSDGVIIIPENKKVLKAGELVEFHPWRF